MNWNLGLAAATAASGRPANCCCPNQWPRRSPQPARTPALSRISALGTRPVSPDHPGKHQPRRVCLEHIRRDRILHEAQASSRRRRYWRAWPRYPLAVADLHEGERVLDLGSGGGIDVLFSGRRVGPSGFAYGVDMTHEMLTLARANAAKAGAENVEFLKGEIEALPLPDAAVDVVISNCVINLSTDKRVPRRAHRSRVNRRIGHLHHRGSPRHALSHHPGRQARHHLTGAATSYVPCHPQTICDVGRRRTRGFVTLRRPGRGHGSCFRRA